MTQHQNVQGKKTRTPLHFSEKNNCNFYKNLLFKHFPTTEVNSVSLSPLPFLKFKVVKFNHEKPLMNL